MTVMSAASAATKPAPAPAGAHPDLVRFENAELIEELNRRIGVGKIEQQELIEEWADGDPEVDADDGPEVDYPPALVDAADWWQRGDRREALHYLEIALGRDFSGLGDLKPEDLL